MRHLQRQAKAIDQLGTSSPRQTRPRPWLIMKLIASAVIISAADHVALVLAILVVAQDDSTDGAQVAQDLVDRGEDLALVGFAPFARRSC